jgi:hypothetical protein
MKSKKEIISIIDIIQKDWESGIINIEKVKKYIEQLPNSLMDKNFFKK